jgi:hypothetical protein
MYYKPLAEAFLRNSARGLGILRSLRSLIRDVPAPSGITVHAVEPGGTVAAKLKLGMGRVLGVFVQGALESLTALPVACLLDRTLQFAQLTFFVVVCHDTRTSFQTTEFARKSASLGCCFQLPLQVPLEVLDGMLIVFQFVVKQP